MLAWLFCTFYIQCLCIALWNRNFHTLLFMGWPQNWYFERIFGLFFVLFGFRCFIYEYFIESFVFFHICFFFVKILDWHRFPLRRICNWEAENPENVSGFLTFIWFQRRRQKMHSQFKNYNIATENCRKLTCNQLDNVLSQCACVCICVNHNESVWSKGIRKLKLYIRFIICFRLE